MRFKFLGLEVSFGKSKNFQQPRRLSARYDSAQTDHMNKRHWANADGLSADEANNPEVRRVLRNRARYERANNSYLESMVDSMADSVIGRGPRLQFLDLIPEVNARMELLFNEWFEGISGPDKLLTGYIASVGDGEMFLVEGNAINQRSPVQLNYTLLDAERCTSGFNSNTRNNIDGVLLDDDGEVVGYTFSNKHPGDRLGMVTILDGSLERFRADQVIHFYKFARPEQHRGVPEITSALPVGARFRDFTLATLDAARIAATFSGVLHTDSGAFDDSDSAGGENADGGFESFDTFALENGTLLTLPDGYDFTQAKAEHPTTTYKEFKRELVAEQSRSIRMPYNVAAGDSSGFNFASGRLDRLTFIKTIDIRQSQVSRRILWTMFQKFFSEGLLIPGFFPEEVKIPGYQPRFSWFFDGDSTIDPQKESKANDTNLKNGSTTHSDVYGRKGEDWRVKFKQISEEKKLAEQLDILDVTFGDSQTTEQAPTNEGVAEALAEEGLNV